MIKLRTARNTVFAAAFVVAGMTGLLLTQQSGRVAPMTAMLSFFVSPAHAVVGRPLTPVSYAGVARRTARRTAYRRY
jgi:hypothetical protein